MRTWCAALATGIAAALAALPEAGRPMALARGDLRWTMAVPAAGVDGVVVRGE